MSGGSLGKKWKIKRVSETEVSIALPEGMTFTSKDLTIEDVVDAYERHKVLQQGEVSGKGGSEVGDEISLRCCSGNTAIAVL
ncbi:MULTISPECIES: hypothetical protein [Alphaproteobacteria]|uniref:hypothetical protein n=1 Tax=Alphaproteobacteria TaxID=28211 RepID=UPI00329A2BB5